MGDLVLSSIKDVIQVIGDGLQYSEALESGNAHESIVSEYIRKTICDLTNQNGSMVVVHTKSIVESVMDQLGNLPLFHALEGSDISDSVDVDPSETLQRSYIRHLMSKLASFGDLHSIKGGFWLPCQVKAVIFPGFEVAFIVGGNATPGIRETFGLEIDNSKCLRTASIVHVNKLIKEGRLKSQSFSEWLSIPEESVEVWLLRMIKVYAKKMEPPFFGGKETFIYLPEATSGELQIGRWANAERKEKIKDGTYLVRCLIKFPFYEYYLAVISSKKGVSHTILSAATIQRKHYRRMMYGFDKLYCRSTRIQIVQNSSSAKVIVRNVLPTEETKLLEALGTVRNDSLHRFPREYTLKAKYLGLLKDAFSRLGIV